MDAITAILANLALDSASAKSRDQLLASLSRQRQARGINYATQEQVKQAHAKSLKLFPNTFKRLARGQE